VTAEQKLNILFYIIKCDKIMANIGIQFFCSQ
jgi:hypothetical protein